MSCLSLLWFASVLLQPARLKQCCDATQPDDAASSVIGSWWSLSCLVHLQCTGLLLLEAAHPTNVLLTSVLLVAAFL
jgi:hypothetical protein